MIPGIDPRIDIAFLKVFGSVEWRELTVSLINAVLEPVSGQHVVEVELLNPYTARMTLSDKLSILDIKARDDRGRLFNVEMQMAMHMSLPKRFLYYWARLYSQQLMRGDDYAQLCPAISICFVNERVFPERTQYHTRFLLQDDDQRLLTDNLEIHVIELDKFGADLSQLEKPLDLWLYFLNNGRELDADALPAAMATREIRQAMEVLKMYSQNELERDAYEARLKWKRDMRALERDREQAQQALAAAQQQATDARQQAADARQQAADARQQVADANRESAGARQQLESVTRERDDLASTVTKAGVIARIQLCERLLGRNATNPAELARCEENPLHDLADSLERELSSHDH